MARVNILLWLFAGLLLVDANAALAARAGDLRFVHGDVRVIAIDGTERPALRGGHIDEGDTITTGSGGAAQVRLVDGGSLAVRASTEVRIDDYRFDGDAGTDRSFLSLLSGSIRSISGLVGRARTTNYRVRTRTATIGIRGSDADMGYDAESGLVAVRTLRGGHTLTSNTPGLEDGAVFTNAGQVAIALPAEPPRLADGFPFELPFERAANKARPPAWASVSTGRQPRPHTTHQQTREQPLLADLAPELVAATDLQSSGPVLTNSHERRTAPRSLQRAGSAP